MAERNASASAQASASVLADRALALIAEESYAAAIGQLRWVAHQPERRVFAYCAIGACFYKLQRCRSAERWLRRALARDPQHRSSRLNLANTLQDLERKDEAVDLYLALLEEDPDNLRVQINACHSLAQLDRIDEALELFERIRQNETAQLADQLELARLLADTSLRKSLLPMLRALIRQHPTCDEAYFVMGHCLHQLQRHDDALPFVRKAAELRPDHQPYLSPLITLYNDLSRPEESISVCEQLLKLFPDSPVLALHYHLVTPIVFSSIQELHFFWARVLNGLRLLLLRRFTRYLTPGMIYPHLFFLAYHDQNVRLPLSLYSDLLACLYGLRGNLNADTSLQQLRSEPEPAQNLAVTCRSWDQRIRIGFASEYFSDHSNSRAFEGLIRNLNREQFEVVLIHGPNAVADETHLGLNRCAQRVVQLRMRNGEFPDHQQIIDLDLDILFYPDLGMNCQMNSLAMRRLAPIQVTGWGLPHSSGVRSIDYYISSALAEPSDGDEHYVETLVRLPGLPCCYLSERLELHEVPRSYFLLPPGAQVFGCLQSLYKINPYFDEALEQLAIANPDAAFVFVENSRAAVTQRFLDRVKITAPHFHAQ